MFKGFAFEEGEVVVSHLQYADDLMILCEASKQNVWVLKAILRCFELVSGLKVNFLKSTIIGINVDEDLMEAAARFLNCKKAVYNLIIWVFLLGSIQGG